MDNRENVRAPTVVLPDLSSHLILHFLDFGAVRIRVIGPRTKAVFFNRQIRSMTYIICNRVFAEYIPFLEKFLPDYMNGKAELETVSRPLIETYNN